MKKVRSYFLATIVTLIALGSMGVSVFASENQTGDMAFQVLEYAQQMFEALHTSADGTQIELICISLLPDGIVPMVVNSLEEAVLFIDKMNQVEFHINEMYLSLEDVFSSSMISPFSTSTMHRVVSKAVSGNSVIVLNAWVTTDNNGMGGRRIISISPYTTANLPSFHSWTQQSAHSAIWSDGSRADVAASGIIRGYILIPNVDFLTVTTRHISVSGTVKAH